MLRYNKEYIKETGGIMEIIDFINNCEYQKQKDFKIALINKDGTVYIADISNDGKRYDFSFPNKLYDTNILNVHTDYYYILFSNYLKEYPELNKGATEANLFKVYESAIKEGLIIMDNSTSYSSPLFTLHGKSANVMIPKDKVTINQLESLNYLKQFLTDFKEVNVQICSFDLIDTDTIIGTGTSSIDKYLKEQGVLDYEKHK